MFRKRVPHRTQGLATIEIGGDSLEGFNCSSPCSWSRAGRACTVMIAEHAQTYPLTLYRLSYVIAHHLATLPCHFILIVCHA